MTSVAAPASPEPAPAPGRPAEIEEWSNRRLVHPLSRALVGALIPTGIAPNAVSALGTVMAALAGSAFVLLPWPAEAGVGAAFGAAASWAWAVAAPSQTAAIALQAMARQAPVISAPPRNRIARRPGPARC